LRDAVRAQAESRRRQFYRNPTPPDKLADQQWLMGEANGMETVLALPDTLVQTIEFELSTEETKHG